VFHSFVFVFSQYSYMDLVSPGLFILVSLFSMIPFLFFPCDQNYCFPSPPPFFSNNFRLSKFLARLNVLTVLEGVLGKFANFWGYIDAN